MFSEPENLASNQELDVKTQLDDGIRMLQGQTHMVDGTLHFCHTSCDLLDAGPVVDYFTKVVEWINVHPDDVVTILLSNGDRADVKSFIDPMEKSGLKKLAYVPPKTPMALADWPTLSSLIKSGKRAVVFMDYKADQAAVPYVLDEFSQLWETPFSPTDPDFPCTVHRPSNLKEAQARDRLYMANHNLNSKINIPGTDDILYPNLDDIAKTNSETGASSLGVAADACTKSHSRPPNFLLVDYYNRGVPSGAVFKVAARLNKVIYKRPCCGKPRPAEPEFSGLGSGQENKDEKKGEEKEPSGLMGVISDIASIFS
ncbi:MAG: hypothetical protein M1833_001773 [Piccolia ochrophora]|nr:MAG: hypothetical protein M1833_001773 [Piccolia ochrophora]